MNEKKNSLYCQSLRETIAKATTPSPAPIKPIFSLLLALIDNREQSIFMIEESVSIILSIYGDSLGVSRTIVMSTLFTQKSLSDKISMVLASNILLSIFLNSGWVSGKWVPISFMPAAPKRASHKA